MLNLFDTYAEEEMEVPESRMPERKVVPASRKKKDNTPEMFNLFSQENAYDEAVQEEDLSLAQAEAEAAWQERRRKMEEERQKRNGTKSV